MIGKIVRRQLREVWKHEALDFTTWLVENIDVLSEALDLSLQEAKREQAAGDFSVDLVAEDDSGNTVVIENQLEKSDHDHLGKLITYLAALDARVAVWIVSEPRPEHTKAVIRSDQRICGVAQTVDRRAHYCVAQSLPKARQGLGESQPKGARILAPRLNPPHAQKTLQSGLKSPDRL